MKGRVGISEVRHGFPPRLAALRYAVLFGYFVNLNRRWTPTGSYHNEKGATVSQTRKSRKKDLKSECFTESRVSKGPYFRRHVSVVTCEGQIAVQRRERDLK
ncbi:unnamed protein product [Sphenostylis stenocarpa]|uniref:Uncharacterized protein n=1 Tax=Sphenostylis stenocarpa TaxID=92480 RepID=A0AA86SLE6_9FABA|nr:unnamed protein product [Sphenostylis stenocarpa]